MRLRQTCLPLLLASPCLGFAVDYPQPLLTHSVGAWAGCAPNGFFLVFLTHFLPAPWPQSLRDALRLQSLQLSPLCCGECLTSVPQNLLPCGSFVHLSKILSPCAPWPFPKCIGAEAPRAPSALNICRLWVAHTSFRAGWTYLFPAQGSFWPSPCSPQPPKCCLLWLTQQPSFSFSYVSVPQALQSKQCPACA